MSAFVLVTPFCFPGCDPVDGTDPYALWETFDDSMGRFHFHYLRPPWEPVSMPVSAKQVFVVEQTDEEPLDSSWTDGDGPGARLVLIVTVFMVADAETVAAREMDAWKEAGGEVEPVDHFMSGSGDVGIWTGARGVDWRMLAVYYDLETIGSVAMRVAGELSNVDTADVMLLLKSLEPRPSEAK